jgi:hypothetical protein
MCEADRLIARVFGVCARALSTVDRKVREVALGAAHPDVGSAMVALGDALQQNGDFMEAEQYYRKGVDIRKVGRRGRQRTLKP